MPHGILGGHAATHPQQIAGVSSLLELVSSIINITLQVVGFKTRYARMVERPGLGPESCDYQSHVLTSCTTSPYKSLTFIHSKGTRIKAHRAYLFYLYTAPSVNGCYSIQYLTEL